MNSNFGSMILAASIAVMGLSFTACSTTTPTVPVKKVEEKKISEQPAMSEEEKHLAYQNDMRKVGEQIKADPNYQKFGLTTDEDKSWFTDLTYKLWDGQISRGEFIASGLEKYPGHSYEFELIADGLTSR